MRPLLLGRCLVGLTLVVAMTGCGADPQTAPQPAATTAAAPPALRVGVVGPLQIQIKGVAVDRGPLAQVAGDRLVLASASSVGTRALAAAAAAHPRSHFALVGASAESLRRPNVAGVRFRDPEAALLAGTVAGLAARDASTAAPTVAWVGPDAPPLVFAFARGARAAARGLVVLRHWSTDQPAACKEAAIAAIMGGATVVAARGGLCAEAAAGAAHEQSQVAVSVTGFELHNVAAQRIVQEALAGVYYGGEDIVFGAASGGIGIANLDPAIPPSVVVQAQIAAQRLATGSPPSG
jgi:basic membrane lipoprotein Med (substrate-binding protein (PBP1-ABC) superfamily)